MRRTTIIIGLLAAGLTAVPAASAARPLTRALAEPVAAQHVERSARNMAAYGAFTVTRTTHTCLRPQARGVVCHYALFVTGLVPEASQTLCLASFTVVRVAGGRIDSQQPGDLTCA